MRTYLALALLWVIAPLSGLAKSAGPLELRAEQLGRQALQQSHSPRAAADLVRLHALRDDLGDLNLLAQPYALLVSRRSTEPNVRDLAHMLYADVERARGHSSKALAMLEPLGFLRSAWVVGSFDNEGKSGCDVNWGPETQPALEATYPSRSRPADGIGWRPLSAAAPDGYVDLGAVVRPNTEAVAYAMTVLEAGDEMRAALSLGTAGAYRLWLNGVLVAKDDRYNRARPDQTRVEVRLRKGSNRLLLKLCNERGPLGYYLRAVRTAGPWATLAGPLPAALPALPRGSGPAPTALPTLADLLSREATKRPDDAGLQRDAATVLAYLYAFDETQREDLALAERAVELAPTDIEGRLLAARLSREDHNVRRAHLEAALKADPKSPFARLELARHELAMEHPDRALELLSPLVEEHPTFAPARLALAATREALAEWPAAARLVEATFHDIPHLPSVTREAARVSQRLHRVSETHDRLRAALGLRYDDTATRRTLAELLADTGRIDEAVAELDTVTRLEPLDLVSQLRLADLLAANGRLADARSRFSRVHELSFDDAEAYEREGRALLSAGEQPEAVAAFRRALVLRPQNPALKEVLRSLEGDDAPIGTQYVVDWKPLLDKANAYSSDDAVYLVDYSYARVESSGLASRFRQSAVKVFTQRGVEAFRTLPIPYAPARQEVRMLRARVSKPDGSIVESYGEADQHMNEPWTGMYYDTRARVLTFPALSAGDVLEVWYRLDDTAQENLLSDYWGDVDTVQSTAAKVRYQYLVDMPATRPLYWSKERLGPGVQSQVEPARNGRVVYRWTASAVPRLVPEPGMPGLAEVASTLHVSTYQTWEQVGRYYWGLVRDQLTASDEVKRAVDQVLRGVDRKDQQAIIRAVYGFVVTNTRYVALEFGIHGYKPYRVDRVLARRFGDCKDKASLMVAMLKLAGIDARLVLLRMRSLGDIGPEPASLAAFNHAIAYVPRYDLYLDGTAEFHGSRELPSSDRSANVLIIEPDGPSVYRTTPEARAEDNTTALSLEVLLHTDGGATLKGSTQVGGAGAPDLRRTYQAVATRTSSLEQSWAQTFPGLKARKVEVGDLGNLESSVKLTYELEVPRFSEASPTALRFFPFASGRAYTQVYAGLAERRHDLELTAPWVNTFDLRFALPPGFEAKDLPEEYAEETPFGRARLTVAVKDGTLVSQGEVAFVLARLKADQYPDFRAWLMRVDQAFSRRVTITRSSGQTAQRGQP